MIYSLSKPYTRIIGVFFILVAVSLVADYVAFGFRPETMHKVFHVGLGVFIIAFGWRDELWWKTFPLVNGFFFSFVALFGVLFPNFGGLDAFNSVDTLLHGVVGVSGIAVAMIDRKRGVGQDTAGRAQYRS